MTEGYEEIKLSEDKQAKVDARQAELQAMLANMQMIDAEFDELDNEMDEQLSLLLKPDLAGLEDQVPASVDLITSKPQTRHARNDEDSDEEDKKDNEDDD